MIPLTNARLREVIARLGYPTPEPARLHLFGLRGAVPVDGERAVRLVANTHNQHNDTIGVFGTELELFLGSVDPGATYTERPTHPEGCAHLVNGCWRYQRGSHRGKPALVQAAAVTVRRDRDRDGKPEDGEKLDTGFFGINIHAAGPSTQVGPYSAGCQVIRGGWDGASWRRFMELIRQADRSGQRVFRYYLFDARELER